MKRPIAQGLASALAMLVLGACGQADAPVVGPADQTPGWTLPPQVEAVEAVGASLIVTGQAAPLGRVVLNASGGLNYAAGADADGRFRLAAPRPARDTLFAVEAQAGQLAYPAPYRLLVAAEPGGPIALLAVGAPTRRLDGDAAAPGSIDAVDTDGRRGLISGRARAGTTLQLMIGGEAREVRSEADGRWSTEVLTVPGGAISLGGTSVTPLLGGGTEGLLTRAGEGWSIAWRGPAGARQTTWFPDGATR